MTPGKLLAGQASLKLNDDIKRESEQQITKCPNCGESATFVGADWILKVNELGKRITELMKELDQALERVKVLEDLLNLVMQKSPMLYDAVKKALGQKGGGRAMSPAGKLQLIRELLGGEDVYDDDGNPTGEKTPQIITPEEAKKLLEIE